MLNAEPCSHLSIHTSKKPSQVEINLILIILTILAILTSLAIWFCDLGATPPVEQNICFSVANCSSVMWSKSLKLRRWLSSWQETKRASYSSQTENKDERGQNTKWISVVMCVYIIYNMYIMIYYMYIIIYIYRERDYIYYIWIINILDIILYIYYYIYIILYILYYM